MSISIDDLRASAGALMSKLDTLEQRSDEAAVRFKDVITAEQQALLDLATQAQATTTQVQLLHGKAQHVADAIRAVMTPLSTVSADVAAELDAIAPAIDVALQQVQTTYVAAQEALKHYAAELTSMTTKIDAWAETRKNDLNILGANAAERADRARSHLQNQSEAIVQLKLLVKMSASNAVATLHSVRAGLDTLHSQVLVQSDIAVHALSESIQSTAVVQVSRPLENQLARARIALQRTSRHVLEKILAEIAELIHCIEGRITTLGRETADAGVAMGPEREALDAMKEPLEAAMNTVRDISNKIGFNL